MRYFPTLLLTLLAGAGCATSSGRLQPDHVANGGVPGSAPISGSQTGPPSPGGPSAPLEDLSPQRQKLVTLARGLIGSTHVHLNGKRYPNDCSGFVQALFDHAGIHLMSAGRRGDNGTQAIFRYAQLHGEIYQRGAPLPGDLVFFRDTYDRNRGGRRNDELTHVGLVESVDKDGTVSVIHRVRRGVVRYRMNLARPDVHTDPRSHQTLNDYLRFAARHARQVLTGELFASYGSVLRSQPKVAGRSIATVSQRRSRASERRPAAGAPAASPACGAPRRGMG